MTKVTKDKYIKSVDTLIRTDLPDKTKEPELHHLVREYQTHSHSRTCRKYKNIPCRFNYGRFFTERTICAEPLPENIVELEKELILENRNVILTKVKKFIQYLNPNKPDYLTITN